MYNSVISCQRCTSYHHPQLSSHCFSLLPLRTDAKMSYGEDFVHGTTTIPFPSGTTSPTIDFEVNIRGEWVLWSNRLGNDVFNLCVF